jgi:hypothetical protein
VDEPLGTAAPNLRGIPRHNAARFVGAAADGQAERGDVAWNIGANDVRGDQLILQWRTEDVLL